MFAVRDRGPVSPQHHRRLSRRFRILLDRLRHLVRRLGVPLRRLGCFRYRPGSRLTLHRPLDYVADTGITRASCHASQTHNQTCDPKTVQARTAIHVILLQGTATRGAIPRFLKASLWMPVRVPVTEVPITPAWRRARDVSHSIREKAHDQGMVLRTSLERPLSLPSLSNAVIAK